MNEHGWHSPTLPPVKSQNSSVAQGLPVAVHAVGAVHWPVNGGGSYWLFASISQHISEYSHHMPQAAALSQHFVAS